jgi:hypothetical protein
MSLLPKGCVAAEKPWGRSWHMYTPTAHGRQKAKLLAVQAGPHALESLRRIKQYVISAPYRRLLREIYREFPDYAAQSVLSLS